MVLALLIGDPMNSHTPARRHSRSGAVMDMSSAWSYLPPLFVVGAAFLFFMDVIAQESRQARSETSDQPSDVIRWGVIGLLLVAAVAHLPVIPDHLRQAPYMGVLFILFTLAAFAVATVLAARPSHLWYLVTSALCVAAIAAYVATRLIAFPQLADDVGAWTEPLGIISISAEAVAASLSAVAVRRPQEKSQSPQRRRTASD
jgi:hypothetical protein